MAGCCGRVCAAALPGGAPAVLRPGGRRPKAKNTAPPGVSVRWALQDRREIRDELAPITTRELELRRRERELGRRYRRLRRGHQPTVAGASSRTAGKAWPAWRRS